MMANNSVIDHVTTAERERDRARAKLTCALDALTKIMIEGDDESSEIAHAALVEIARGGEARGDATA